MTSLSWEQVQQAGVTAYWSDRERELRYNPDGVVWAHSLMPAQDGVGAAWQRIPPEAAPRDSWTHGEGCCCAYCRPMPGAS